MPITWVLRYWQAEVCKVCFPVKAKQAGVYATPGSLQASLNYKKRGWPPEAKERKITFDTMYSVSKKKRYLAKQGFMSHVEPS